MLKILVSCAGGMSSGILSKKLEKELISRDLEERVKVSFVGFHNSWQIADQYNIIMCCPHQRYEVPKMMAEHGDQIHVPITIIPPRLYGTFRSDDIIQDALDLIEIYKTNPVNPCHFPEEDNAVSIQRSYSHRRSIEHKENDIVSALEKFENNN